MKRVNYIGRQFGRLKVVGHGPNLIRDGRIKGTRWECVCECGQITTVLTGSLQQGKTKSCGCLQREVTVQRSTIHGMRHHRLWHVWQGMRQRCENPYSDRYKDWGGRGISVCPEWHSFEAFMSDMAPSWIPGLSIDRIDNNKGYSASNCRWATRAEQSKNKRPRSSYPPRLNGKFIKAIRSLSPIGKTT